VKLNSHEHDNISAFLAKAGGKVAQRLQYALETPTMEGWITRHA